MKPVLSARFWRGLLVVLAFYLAVGALISALILGIAEGVVW